MGLNEVFPVITTEIHPEKITVKNKNKIVEVFKINHSWKTLQNILSQLLSISMAVNRVNRVLIDTV